MSLSDGTEKRSSGSISVAETSFRNNIEDDREPHDCVNRENDKTDPGACRHGNFMNYYQFHPAKERLIQLPRDVWHADVSDRKYVGIDVGCNAGDLTVGLYDFLKKNLDTDVSLLGVDLDPILIERAREGARKILKPCDAAAVTYNCVDIMSPDSSGVIEEYLNGKDRALFDVAFCFSVTMWIHLNHGDDGLVKFLKTVCEKTRLIVVEPQPWRCYRNALRRLRRANVKDIPSIDNLRYKGDVEHHVENILANEEHCGFEKITESTDYNDWGRKLLIYRRRRNIN